MKFRSPSRQSKSAFTLIELLVVIAIIAILAAILFPVFARARENARKASCMSNLKQIGLGLMQYSQDYDEKFPNNGQYGTGSTGNNYATNNNGNWMRGVQPYIKSWQIFLCPSATTGGGLAPNGNSDTNYFQNAVVLGRSMAAIQSSSTLIWAHEYAFRSDIGFCRPHSFPDDQPAPYNGNYNGWIEAPGGTDYKYDKIHFDGGNLLFCDGHVKWRRQDTIIAREFGLNSDLRGAQPASIAVGVDTAQVG
ncbi:DUF1559 domain-containing protein [bacterium]|nr:MAG: DUF1559 domain-containing protein [bacterium]